MTTRAKNKTTAAGAVGVNPQAGVNPNAAGVTLPEEVDTTAPEDTVKEGEVSIDDVEDADFPIDWDGIMDEVADVKTQADIVRECLTRPKEFKLHKNLRIKNVKTVVYRASTGNRTTRITLIVDKPIAGMVKDSKNLDAFGEPTVKLGPSTNVFTSAFALSGAMKESPKGAIYADKVSSITAVLLDNKPVEVTGKDNLPNILYAGGECDILCQLVPAGHPYHNPFSTKDEDDGTIFPINRIFHHVVRVSFGEVGEDKYRADL